MGQPLAGTTVLIAGAGLAGLTAAHDFSGLGAEVTVIDARNRVGGRVWTIRDGFSDEQHAEAGGDMLDEAQHEILDLCGHLGLKLTRILRGGFGNVRTDPSTITHVVSRDGSRDWERLARSLGDVIRPYRLAEHRWDSPIAADLARRSVASWLDEVRANEEIRTTAAAVCADFFLADPEELSLIALVDQFANDDGPWLRKMYRIEGGNDRLATALAAPLTDRLRLNTDLVAVSRCSQGVRATLKQGRTTAPFSCDYLVLTLPATTLRRVPITPALPAQQHEAIAQLRYGRAAKTLMQFSRRFWRKPARPNAFGSALPFGAVWDGNEQQQGRPGILALLAGGRASDESQAILARDGPPGLVETLDWLGSKRALLMATRQIVWEHDRLACGGYAFFDPTFDPSLCAWLARPAGRVFFAGEHTSLKWQGYMNGAVESGRRAAAEIVAVHPHEH